MLKIPSRYFGRRRRIQIMSLSLEASEASFGHGSKYQRCRPIAKTPDIDSYRSNISIKIFMLVVVDNKAREQESTS
jgi:hypothetical protein